MYFPSPMDGEIPRYVYLGELVGEQNFVYPEEKKPGFLVTAFRWVVGLFDEENVVELIRPQAVVSDERGRVLVTDVGRPGVLVFDEGQGHLDVWEMAHGLTKFVTPIGIALGPDGKVFVADADLRRVVLLDPSGNGQKFIDEAQLERPTGLAWDPEGQVLYVADTRAHQIKVFDMAGKLVRTIGVRGEGPGEFNYPLHIAFSHGKLIVSDTMNARIQVLSADGKVPPRIIGKRGLYVGEFVRPKGVAMDSESNVYAIESYHDHLLVFDSSGRLLLPIGGTGKSHGEFYLPGGLWVDSRNRVYVADTFNGRVVLFQFLGGGAESE